jgi:hypothetical protein
VNKAQRNGNGREYVATAAEFPQRRMREIDISEDADHPKIVVVRAMSGGERRRFLGRANKPNPDNHLEMIRDVEWMDSGERDHALIALTTYTASGEALYPQARARALRVIGAGPDWQRMVKDDEFDPDGIDDVDPGVLLLLGNAADTVSLITVGAVEAFAASPLALKNSSHTTGAPPSELPILSAS